jgi:ABC-2 type transport system ATP-binding protein
LTGTTSVRFDAVDGLDVASLSREVGIDFRVEGDVVTATLAQAQSQLLALLQYVEREGVELDGLEVVRPTLDDVFLDVTGERS